MRFYDIIFRKAGIKVTVQSTSKKAASEAALAYVRIEKKDCTFSEIPRIMERTFQMGDKVPEALTAVELEVV